MPKTNNRQQPSHLSMALIVLANAWPLLGVLFFDWDIASVVILYWVENIIIGLATLVKMLAAKQAPNAQKFSLCPFFCFHFGFFCFGHLVFIKRLIEPATLSPHHFFTLGFVGAILSLISFHSMQVYQDYFKPKLHLVSHIGAIMFTPYKHIVVIHIAILGSAFMAGQHVGALWFLVLLIIGKTAIELGFSTKGLGRKRAQISSDYS